jgi:5-oxopent-3-ene-1,2,5-tricarboxylate decarboxylase/2-hydroxyhepta-2,4-diene-1,7-dioate isomerase
MTMIAGTIYGAALNDRDQVASLAAAFEKPPHNTPPRRPVLYIKPRNCLMGDSGVIPLPSDWACVEAGPTLGLLIGRDASRVEPGTAFDHVAGVCLALDIGEPDAGFYRPPVQQRCRDGFLRLGPMAAFDPGVLEGNLETRVNDVAVHAWSPRRLLRDAASLIAAVTGFMTLAAGDLLLIGLPHDVPRLRDGERITVSAEGLPRLSAQLRREATV